MSNAHAGCTVSVVVNYNSMTIFSFVPSKQNQEKIQEVSSGGVVDLLLVFMAILFSV